MSEASRPQAKPGGGSEAVGQPGVYLAPERSSVKLGGEQRSSHEIPPNIREIMESFPAVQNH